MYFSEKKLRRNENKNMYNFVKNQLNLKHFDAFEISLFLLKFYSTMDSDSHKINLNLEKHFFLNMKTYLCYIMKFFFLIIEMESAWINLIKSFCQNIYFISFRVQTIIKIKKSVSIYVIDTIFSQFFFKLYPYKFEVMFSK